MFTYFVYDFLFPTRERVVFEVGVKMKHNALICMGIFKDNQIDKIKKEGY